MKACVNCGEGTSNPKFCSRSCSTTFSNKAKPKRVTTKVCTRCELPPKSWRHTLCEHHHEENKLGKYQSKTVGEYRAKLSVAGRHPSWVNAHIRGFARSWLKHLTKESCRHCGYDKHVELAHIKAVSEFNNDALLSEVNCELNVIPLCPNCHWEFDNLPRL